MTASINDFNQFTGLRVAAEKNDPAVLREVASQFEALFLQTMLKNMREASLGEDLMGTSNQHDLYQGMMDQQLALEMASGKGVGLAEMLVRQLGGDEAANVSRPDRDYFPAGMPRNSPVASVEPLPAWSDPKAFARDIWPHAERAGRRLNVAPEAIVAQAALETGWGAHVMPDRRGDSSFNLFGIKAGSGWRGEQVSRRTLEFENGIPMPQNAAFRSYDDVAATFDDYTRFLSDNPRYSSVSGHGSDVAGFARALQDSGYATDPKYADKLTRIVNSPTMRSVMSTLKNSVAQPIKAQLSLRAQ
jgi:flagellar protein FlgJ